MKARPLGARQPETGHRSGDVRSITAGDKDFSTPVARLKKENIDFVYFGGYYPEMGQILRQAKQVG